MTDPMNTHNSGANQLASDDRSQRKAEVRNVIFMSIPVVVTFSSRAFMDIADYIMITGLGTGNAQAAILPAQIVMWCYIIIGVGIVSVVNTFAAQALGRGRPHDCSAYAWQTIYIAAFFGIVGLALRPFLPGLLSLFGHEPIIQSLELAYADVALLTVAPTTIAFGLGWFFVGVHRPWTTMWSAIEANMVNIVVSFVLIYGKLGFEPMGIAGAAWGTLVAVCYRSIRLGLTLIAPRANEEFGSRKTWRPSWRFLKDLLRVGIPCSMQWLCEVVVWAVFVNVLIGSKFGTVHLIATNTAWQYMRLAFMPVVGVGQALTALVGKSIGSGNPQRAMREASLAAKITVVYMGTLSCIYFFKGAALIGFFSQDPEVIRIGANIMICAAVFQLFDGIAISYNSALRGAGDTFVPSVFMIVSNWVIIVGGGFAIVALVPQWESTGAWLAASTLIVVTGFFMWWRWQSKAWMNIDLFGDGPADPPSLPEEKCSDAATANKTVATAS